MPALGRHDRDVVHVAAPAVVAAENSTNEVLPAEGNPRQSEIPLEVLGDRGALVRLGQADPLGGAPQGDHRVVVGGHHRPDEDVVPRHVAGLGYLLNRISMTSPSRTR